MFRYFALTATSLFLSTGAFAQAEDPFGQCSNITNSAQRLACYDAAQAAARHAPVQALPPVQPAPPSTPRRLVAGIASYKFDKNGKFTVTLDNGEIWRQEKTDNGQAQFNRNRRNIVVITPGFWGSYNLQLNNLNTRFKVDRIKPRAK